MKHTIDMVPIPSDVLGDLHGVQRLGVHLAQYDRVVETLTENNLHKALLWVTDHKDEYAQGVENGFIPTGGKT